MVDTYQGDSPISSDEKYLKTFDDTMNELEQKIQLYRRRAGGLKRRHNFFSMVSVLGGVVGPAVTAYLIAAPPQQAGTNLAIELTVIGIAAALGGFGSIQRVFSFDKKYVTSANGLINLIDERYEMEAKFERWDNTFTSPTYTDLITAIRNAQNAMKSVEREFILAEMNIIQASNQRIDAQAQ